MTKQEMYNYIRKENERIQKNKTKRCLLMILGLAVVLYIIIRFLFKQDILDSIVLATVGSGLYFFLGMLIWLPFVRANDRENNHLEELKKEYQEIYKHPWV